MKQIHLERVTWDNYYAIMCLRVARGQRDFVAPNEWSIVHAYAAQESGYAVYPFGIYCGKRPVGFAMAAFDPPFLGEGHPEPLKHSYWIWRFMIAKRYQGRGYGREALKLLVDFIKTFPAGKADTCWISYEPSNEGARHLYTSFGFVETPEYYEEVGEMPACLKL